MTARIETGSTEPARTGPPPLDDHLRDPDPRVRRAAVELVGQTLPPGAGDALAWALADEDAEVRATAAELLTLTRPRVGRDGLDALRLAAAGGRDALVRRAAADQLDSLAEAARTLYAQGLADGEPQVRAQAVLSLIVLRSAGGVRDAADDPAREVRVAVAEGLARLGSADGLEHLLADHDPVVRLAALDAAASLGLPAVLVPRAALSLTHAGWQVRERAVRTLAASSAEQAVGHLVRALRDPVVDVRRSAVRALERWADRHPRALAALTDALSDSDPGVRTQARWSLARTRGETRLRTA